MTGKRSSFKRIRWSSIESLNIQADYGRRWPVHKTNLESNCFSANFQVFSLTEYCHNVWFMLIRCYFECCLHCAYTTVLCDESSRLIYWNVNFGHEYSRDGNWFFIMTHFPAYFNAFASYKSWCFAPHWRGPRKFSLILCKWANAHGCGLNRLALHALSCFEYLVDLHSTSRRPAWPFDFRTANCGRAILLFRLSAVECPLYGDKVNFVLQFCRLFVWETH